MWKFKKTEKLQKNIMAYPKDGRDLLRVFLVGLLLAFCIFLPFLIFDKGMFVYYGDYDVQQIPFYRLCHDAVRNGAFGWNWNTDLGVNFIGSYSFYTLGSPFFWLTVPFPNAWVPYLMAPLFMLKFALTGVTGYMYINRFTKTSKAAVLGGLLYAFSGFNLYNIFFNHFNEVVLCFPLLLIAMEEFVVNNRRGGFVLAVALCATLNYYFFFGEVIFCIIYFFIRLPFKDFPITFKKFLLLFLEAVLGVLLAAFMLMPAIFALAGNPRPSETIEGFGALIYNSAQRYGLILSSMFFPPDIPARPNFFPDSNAKWASVSLFLPMFSMVGVIAFLKANKKNFIKTILIVSGIIAFVPFLNSAFSAFNYGYYARWFYMPILFMALATVISLESHMDDFPFALKVTAGFIAFFALIGIMPKRTDGKLEWFTLAPYPERFWSYILIAILGIACISLLINMTKQHKRFAVCTLSCFCAITLITAEFMILTGKTEGHGYELVVERGIYGAEKMSLPKDQFYRMDSYDEIDNLGMFLKIPTINAFHSIVPSSVMDYYELVGEERGVGSRPNPDKIGIRALTSVRYALADKDKKDAEIPIGFNYIDTQNDYKIYENKNFIPMGFAFDYTVTQEQMTSAADYKDRLLLKGLYVSPNDKDDDFKDFLPKYASDDSLHNVLSSLDDFSETCDKLTENSVENFTYDSNGFWATYTADKKQAVFFSVPYDKGFSASVNGKSVPIIKANGGFMAVEVDSGNNAIVFSYRTPGLMIGAIISFIALLILAAYMVVVYYLRKKDPANYRYDKTAHIKKELPSVDSVFINETPLE